MCIYLINNNIIYEIHESDLYPQPVVIPNVPHTDVSGCDSCHAIWAVSSSSSSILLITVSDIPSILLAPNNLTILSMRAFISASARSTFVSKLGIVVSSIVLTFSCNVCKASDWYAKVWYIDIESSSNLSNIFVLNIFMY